MCATLDGTISLSSPTRAFPVARMRFSPLAVNGMSDVPVCRPLSDHSVSPWRMMKARGVVIAGDDGDVDRSQGVDGPLYTQSVEEVHRLAIIRSTQGNLGHGWVRCEKLPKSKRCHPSWLLRLDSKRDRREVFCTPESPLCEDVVVLNLKMISISNRASAKQC